MINIVKSDGQWQVIDTKPEGGREVIFTGSRKDCVEVFLTPAAKPEEKPKAKAKAKKDGDE